MMHVTAIPAASIIAMTSADLARAAGAEASRTGIDQRAHIRWRGDAPHPVRLIQGRNRHACGIKDISAGGAALTRDFDAWPGERVAVELNDMVRLPGVVLRLGAGTLAIKFQLPAELAASIDQAIQLGLSPAEW